MTLTNSKDSSDTSDVSLMKNNYNQIVDAIKCMDIPMLHLILDEKINYNDLPKNEFLYLLNAVFEQMQKEGDNFLEAHKGYCSNCFMGRQGITFIGNKSRNYFDIAFEKNRQGLVRNLRQCDLFMNNVLLDGYSLAKEIRIENN